MLGRIYDCGGKKEGGYLVAVDNFSNTLPKRWLPAFDTESTACSAMLFDSRTVASVDGVV